MGLAEAETNGRIPCQHAIEKYGRGITRAVDDPGEMPGELEIAAASYLCG
jgi:hypothetical protein